jgi:hypothetical protein
MKSIVFWAVKPYTSETARRFGRTCLLHIQGPNVSQEINQQKQATWLASAGFLFVVPFHIEDGGDMFLRNYGLLRTARR